MTPEDLRILCLALGFTTVVAEQDMVATDCGRRAVGFAALIESFCAQAIPNLKTVANQEEASRVDQLIENLKYDISTKGEVNVQKDRNTLRQIHDRLRQRFSAYADDGMIADRVMEMLDDELNYGITSES